MIRQEHTVTQAKLAINVAESHRLAKEQFKVNQRLAQARHMTTIALQLSWLLCNLLQGLVG